MLIFKISFRRNIHISLRFTYILSILNIWAYFLRAADSNLPTNTYLFKFNSRNNRKSCGTCSKVTIKTQERCQWYRSGVSIVNLDHISHLFLVFILLTLQLHRQGSFMFLQFTFWIILMKKFLLLGSISE